MFYQPINEPVRDDISGIPSLDKLAVFIGLRRDVLYALRTELLAKIESLPSELNIQFITASIDAAQFYYAFKLGDENGDTDTGYKLAMSMIKSSLRDIKHVADGDSNSRNARLLALVILASGSAPVTADDTLLAELYQAIMDCYCAVAEPDDIIKKAIDLRLWNRACIDSDTLISEIGKLQSPDLFTLLKWVRQIQTSPDSSVQFMKDFADLTTVVKMNWGKNKHYIRLYSKYIPNAEDYLFEVLYQLNKPSYHEYIALKEMKHLWDLFEQMHLATSIRINFFRDAITQLSPFYLGEERYRIIYPIVWSFITRECPMDILEKAEKDYTLYMSTVDAVATEASSPASTTSRRTNFDRVSKEDRKPSNTKSSASMHKGQTALYKGYKAYKDKEDVIDSQLTKMVTAASKIVTGTENVKTEIIEGKSYSVIGILKKILSTAAIFSYSKVGAICLLIMRYVVKKNVTATERRRIMQDIDVELKLIDEKIDDARGDGDRDAKYALMRTKEELVKTRDKLRYGLEADTKTLKSAKAYLSERR